jgi:hypothetical protein
MPFGDENAGKTRSQSIKKKERSGRKVLLMNNNQRVIMYYGRGRLFSLGCHTGRIIYCYTTMI